MGEYLESITYNGTEYELHDTGSRDATAPEYDALTFPVSAGKSCWHEGTLYRAKQAIPSSESWTAAHWEAAPSVMGQVADLKSAIDEITEDIEIETQDLLNSATEMVKGFRDSRNSGAINSQYDGFLCTTLIPVNENDVVKVYGPTITGVQISTTGVYFDSNKDYVGVVKSGATYGDFSFTVPSDVAYISINAYRSDVSDYTKIPSGFVININDAHVTIEEKRVPLESLKNVGPEHSGDMLGVDEDGYIVLTEKTDVVVDPTLTNEGEAADAKETGDEISAIKAVLSEITVKEGTGELINFATAMAKGFRDSRNSGQITTTYDGFRCTTLIPVKAGDVVKVSNPTENSVTISTTGVFFNSNNEYLGVVKSGSTYGDFNFTVPDNGEAYISINAYRADTTDYTTVPNGFFISINDEEIIVQENRLPINKLQNVGTENSGKILRVDADGNIGVSGQDSFNGLLGVAFGTSLTYRSQTTGGYLQYLPDLSGITFDNQGIGSSYIYGNMLTAIKGYTGYTGKRVCLLEGFVNDWGNNKTLGTWKDTEETSVCGCVRSALNYMLSQNANMTVFLILDPYGRNYAGSNCSSTAVNSAGLTQFEFYEEVAKVAESLGIPVIKMYAKSQISENTPQYLMDNIHPNTLGAKQSANFIWAQMRQYMPNTIS